MFETRMIVPVVKRVLGCAAESRLLAHGFEDLLGCV